MKTPWFMVTNRNGDTMVGIYDTPHGTYVRSSYRDKTTDAAMVEVKFYPHEGTARIAESVILINITAGWTRNPEDQIDDAVTTDKTRRGVNPDVSTEERLQSLATTPDKGWEASFSARKGRDKSDCTDLIFTRVAGIEYQLYPNEAALLTLVLLRALSHG